MNLTILLDMIADGCGDRVLVGRRRDGLTAAGLRATALRGADRVRRSGADAIVYLAVNGPAFPIALFAAAYAGVPLVPLNFRLGTQQLETLLAGHRNALVLADPATRPALGAHPTPPLTTAEWLQTTTDGPVPGGGFGDDEVPAVIIYTSGTTSAPKGVLLRHENLTSYVVGSVEFASADAEQAALVSVPPYHIAAVANVLTNLYAGRRLLVLERFDPADWLDTVRTEQVTNALVVPTMLTRIVDSAADKAVPSLRALAYGGAPMPAPVIERALRLWPDIDFVNAYGLTETSSTICLLTPDDHRAALAAQDDAGRARLASVGRPVPGVQIEIRDGEGNQVPPGQRGRIHVSGPQVSAEYQGVGRMVDDHGYFDTRDEGYLDEEGYLFLGGRTDDTIIRGAENIAPAEIEEVLLRHPAVADTAVIGVADEEWGQRIVAVVVLRDTHTADPAELRGFVRAALRSSKTPDEIVFWAQLPRTETGKLVRREIVGRFRAQVV